MSKRSTIDKMEEKLVENEKWLALYRAASAIMVDYNLWKHLDKMNATDRNNSIASLTMLNKALETLNKP